LVCAEERSPHYDFGKAMAVRNYGKYNSEDLKMNLINNRSFTNYVKSTQALETNQSPI